MIPKTLATLVLSSMALAGCVFTPQLWDQRFSDRESKLQREQIYAFGFTKPTSQTLTPNRLIMMGEKSVYVTEVTPEHDLAKALRTTELSKPFVGMGYAIYTDFGNRTDGSFEVTSGYDKKENSSLCLGYSFDNSIDAATQQRETVRLKALGFEEYKANAYRRCYGKIRGTRYAMSESLPAEYRFQTPVEVVLITTTGSGYNVGLLAGAVLLTPITLIGDVLMLPMMPFLWPRGTRI